MKLAIQKHELNDKRMKPDVVLIHGTGAHAGLWSPQIQLLVQKGYRCFGVDLRGHGDTHEPGEPTDLEVHMADLLESFDHYGVKFPAIFIGHSLGAILSVKLAERYPEMFQKILAVSMPGKVPALVLGIVSFILNQPYKPLRGSLIHRCLTLRQQIFFETSQHSLQQIIAELKEINLLDVPLKVSCPIHFATGRLDIVAPFWHVQKVHNQLPGSTYKVFEWSGHCCMDDQREQFNSWMLECLSEASAA